MWPRYETVVRPAAPAATTMTYCSCNVATVRDRGATRVPAPRPSGAGRAAMWPRYETVVRLMRQPHPAFHGAAAMWPRYETVVRPAVGRCRGHGRRRCNVATVRDRGATALAPWDGPRRLAAMWPRYETVVRPNGTLVKRCRWQQLQCGHGTRPWCDFHKSCPVAEFAAAMWPRYETVVRLGERALRAHGLGRCNVATVRDRGATCRLVAVRERGPGCNVATVRDRGATRSGRWPRRPPAGCNVATVRDRGATGHPPSAGRRPPGCNVATVRDRGATARRGGGDHGLRQAAMWPRYETVVRRAVVATGPRPRSCNVATVRDRGATWSATRRCLPTAAAMWPRYETVVRRRPRTLPSPPASCNVATVRDRGATAPAEFGNRPPPPSRERHRTPSAAPAEFGRLREPRVHGGWS